MLQLGVAVVVVGGVVSPWRAVAQSPGAEEPAPGEVEEFKRRLARGVEAFRRERYEAALEAFREASKIATPPSLQFKIGRALEELERCDRARHVYEAYLENDELSDEKRARGERRLDELAEVCGEEGTISVTCRPSSAEATVRVASRELGCGDRVDVEEGEHRVELQTAEGERQNRTVEVQAGETADVAFRVGDSAGTEGASSTERDALSWQKTLQYGGMITGGGLLVAGLATDLSTQGRLTEIRRAERAGELERVRRLERAASAARSRTVGFYVAGGVLTVASAVWFAVDSSGERQSSATVGGAEIRASGSGIRLTW